VKVYHFETSWKYVYCIVRCPYCKNLQGGQYPVKMTKCQVCSKRISLEKVGLIGVYDDLKEMQGNLMVMKWSGENEDDLKGIIKVADTPIERKKTSGGRDGIRKMILEKLETDLPREVLIKDMVKEGNDMELVENVLDELIEMGLIHYPRYSLLRKVRTIKQ